MKKQDEPVYIIDIFKDVRDGVFLETGIDLNYVYGTNIHVLNNLKMKDSSITVRKYPLFALYMPIRIERGKGYYANPLIVRKIIFASLTEKDDLPEQRYEKVFKQVLYPAYYSFLRNLRKHKLIVCGGVDTIKHELYEFFQTEKVSGINDFVDTLQINNLTLTINQTKFC